MTGSVPSTPSSVRKMTFFLLFATPLAAQCALTVCVKRRREILHQTHDEERYLRLLPPTLAFYYIPSFNPS
jgi:hypothetical protein